jgi:cyclohexyl-isocyanide hydratase
LLKGRRAATHWAYVDLLPLVGASHEKSRIVRDGNVFTSGESLQELTSHFASWRNLLGPRSRKLFNSPSSTTLRLFDAGHPDKASEATTAFMVQRNEKAHAGIRDTLEKLAHP